MYVFMVGIYTTIVTDIAFGRAVPRRFHCGMGNGIGFSDLTETEFVVVPAIGWDRLVAMGHRGRFLHIFLLGVFNEPHGFTDPGLNRLSSFAPEGLGPVILHAP